MELAGALSNRADVRSLRQLGQIRERALKYPRPRNAHQATRNRPGSIWPAVRAILVRADGPMTPAEVRARLEMEHGRPLAASTVKDCLRRNATATGEVRRLKGGRYRLRRKLLT